MMMLLIGALVIGYLLYFFTSSFRNWSNQTAVDRTDDDRAADDLILLHSHVDADQKAKDLEARIAVLERLIEAPTDKTGE
jgi:hypothetical protein